MDNSLQTIMLVDDDEASIFFNTEIIEECGLVDHVEVFQDPVEALGFVSHSSDAADSGAHRPDVILLDLNMPKMSGWEFMDAYRESAPRDMRDIPVVVLTSSSNQRDVEKASTTEGIVAYVVKPLSEAKLKKIIAFISEDVE